MLGIPPIDVIDVFLGMVWDGLFYWRKKHMTLTFKKRASENLPMGRPVPNSLGQGEAIASNKLWLGKLVDSWMENDGQFYRSR